MTKQEFLTSSGLQVQVLEFWLEQRWLLPEEAEAGMFFSETDVARAHFIRQLKDDLGANDAGIDVILHLVDQVHGLRRVLVELREGMKGRQD
ncbi:MerR family transcriptional regulator [Bosea sp. SSUT16]|jgi:chaperone modulatory protein CbpM|uniref:MerR family transcriptional regulator n=2 Tax=Boseaceae TaxID=2831100 RepID=A0A927HZW8_9HYPH|nr:chaperone modulator CbpM [Bosea sp. UNC402CLCol]MBD3845742.1 MerR family transcriptional regulator [Bosea spartocytisi]MCT4473035.1 chaperone modulator CbpM [Bosea spartocytisi]